MAIYGARMFESFHVGFQYMKHEHKSIEQDISCLDKDLVKFGDRFMNIRENGSRLDNIALDLGAVFHIGRYLDVVEYAFSSKFDLYSAEYPTACREDEASVKLLS